MPTLSSAQLTDLRNKLRLLLGDSDALYTDALTIFDNETTNTTSSTVAFSGTTLTLVGNSSGTNTFDVSTALYDTLGELVDGINALGTGQVATLAYAENADPQYLQDRQAISILGESNTQTLRIQNVELLDLLIESSYAAVESALNRGIVSASYEEVYDADSVIVLQEPDVISVERIFTDVDNAITVEYAASAGEFATVEVTGTTLVFNYGVNEDAGLSTDTITLSSYPTMSALATQIATLSDWSATVQASVPSNWLIRTGPRTVADQGNARPITLEAWIPDDVETDIDYESGTITFQCPVGNRRGRIRINYTAGFTTIPDDLEGVILNVAKGLQEEQAKDSSVIEERLGDYSYKLGDQGRAALSSLVLDHESVLRRYRRVYP